MCPAMPQKKCDSSRSRRQSRRVLEKDCCVGFVVQTFQHIPPVLVYMLLAVFLLLESSGIPLLNTTLLLCTGALAALGSLNLGLLMFVSITGSVLGACLAYGLGRRYGERFLFRVARFLHIKEQRIALIESWFQKTGAGMIFISRIVPYIRPFSCFPAGIAGMPFVRFLLAVLIGSTIWCVTFLLLGWVLGPQWRMVIHMMRFYTIPTLIGLAILLLIYLLFRRTINRSVKKHLTLHGE